MMKMKIVIETEKEYEIVMNMIEEYINAKEGTEGWEILDWLGDAIWRWEAVHNPWIWRYYEVEKGESK